jgi:hypothetical protein
MGLGDWLKKTYGNVDQSVFGGHLPGGATPGSHLSYSPWCIPQTLGGIKCVVVHTDLRVYEPMAWDFLMNFAKDNNLQVSEACLLPEHPQ